MNERRLTSLVEFLGILAMALWLSGCQAKCQPSTDPITSLSAGEMRMVSTTDPTVTSLTNTNFLTMTFFNNYTGEVHKVQNNNRYNQPALVFTYNVDPDTNTLKLQYSTPPSGQNSGDPGSQDSGGTPVGNQKKYTYTLSTDLVLTDTTSGFVYRFVPFNGIVRPDQQCTF